MPAAQIRVSMEEKYAWARQANDVVQEQTRLYHSVNAKEDDPNDLSEAKQAFWSFLQAYQQIRFYHGVWMKQINKPGKATAELDKWKALFLTPEQIQAWDLLNQLRNQDTHDSPVLPDIKAIPQVLSVNGSAILINGHLVGMGHSKNLVISIANDDHRLAHLTATNLLLLRQFIDTFDQVP
ncbi:hypothetical protein GO988_11285 [Hymenobacter sp. HMF4947]|uniref:Uncharacterized protein n=1 Tax=Hymenobacter ginkgonis TaxID=2682976 RepID=A0A7K1TES1_9BACT|nr:hypothetical protein [Hymenobacter ginkgonis]MVN76907.1 hypothetical protein [Hymenobacter ginkgonis]